jgi:hypothetical protein
MDAEATLRRSVKAFWMFMPWLPYHISLAKLNKHCAFSNDEEMFWSHPAAGKFAKKELPTAKLELTLESFDVDCFFVGSFTLVSEKMRSAMALAAADVQYFDVDASRSARLPQSKHYQIMHIPVTEDVSDPENSDYTYHHWSDGSVTGGSPIAAAFRPDAKPTHEIFYDKFFKVIYSTDEFALRVLRAGCSGIRFFDPARGFGGDASAFRTVRGVEQEVKWDPFRKILRTKLIQEIP